MNQQLNEPEELEMLKLTKKAILKTAGKIGFIPYENYYKKIEERINILEQR